MDNKKIAVYYIATGDYKRLFKDFLDSVSNLFPNSIKIVKVISDGLEEYKDYEKDNVKVELCPRINDYPWPIITLYKMWHILQNRDDSCDFACYFNGNAVIHKHSESVFDLNKITVSYHSFNSDGQTYDPWPYIDINKYSTAYLENGTYEYIQGGFFFGPSKLIYKMCEEVVQMVKDDTNRKIIAQWHDESYLNKWCVVNQHLVDKKYIMAIYESSLNENRFVFLRDKRDVDIKRN